jgi:cytoskeleton protein RodZ
MPETIGQRLKKAREYRNLTLEKAEEATRIRLQYLQALEADDFSSMPSPVQARGFLRNYAEYLDLDLDAIIDEMRQSEGQGSEIEPEVVFEGEEIEEKETVQESANEVVEEDHTDLDELSVQSSSQTRNQRSNRKPKKEETAAPHSNPEPSSIEELKSNPEMETSSKVGGVVLNFWYAAREWITSRLKNTPEQTIEVQDDVAEEIETPISEQDLESPQDIFNNIGEQLFNRRVMLNLTLDEIERHTKLRAYFLKSLEEGRMEDLPSPVQTRGMLSNYAKFLDLDVDALLFRFAEALQAQHRERHPEKPARDRNQPIVPEKMPVWRAFIAGDLFFGIGTVLFMVILSIWGISQIINMQREQAVDMEATAPSIAEVLIEPIGSETDPATYIADNTQQPELPERTLTIPTQELNVPVQVNIVVVERTYMRVSVDGDVEFDGRVIPGNAYPFEAQENIEVLVGNAAAVRLIYNQKDLGLLGSFGQLVHFIYTSDDVVTPTPFIPPTATNTPFVTSTPTQTPSPTTTPTSEE